MPRTHAIEIRGNVTTGMLSILTPEALNFIVNLTKTFGGWRNDLLTERKNRQELLNAGKMPTFHPTGWVIESNWRIAALPKDLEDRRVEITGPASDRKMVINALNSGAQVYMTDFEDSMSPTWTNVMLGQINVRDAVKGTISFESAGKNYALNPKTAVLFVRPRGWHLDEKHVLVEDNPVPASLFDFGLFMFWNAKELLNQGKRPYFYLPKLEGLSEAQLWNSVFAYAQAYLGIPYGTIRATVLIETILAAFEMEGILYALQDHSAGLNAGRWDYLFSWIKKLQAQPSAVLPDRSLLGMGQPFMRCYAELLVRTCHKRGAPAIGGMSAYIPVRGDPDANERALEKVRQDKLTEVFRGFDGTWVAHPGLVGVAKSIFDQNMSGPNQIDNLREDVRVDPADLLRVPTGEITLDGLRTNINVGIQYLASWLCGNGCVPINNLMEDAATAEISRSQIWQWVHHSAVTNAGVTITPQLVETILNDELDKLRVSLGDDRFQDGKYDLAAVILYKLATNENFVDFLTVPAYEHLE